MLLPPPVLRDELVVISEEGGVRALRLSQLLPELVSLGLAA